MESKPLTGGMGLDDMGLAFQPAYSFDMSRRREL
jgi:hypothetical protein